jgi:hypothetical protein
MFSLIEQLQELIKSYYIVSNYDTQKAQRILRELNALRWEIAIDAEQRSIFWEQQNIPALATGYQQTVWFSRNDIKYNLVRALADLDVGVTISTVNQGNRQRIITREPINWQQLFPQVQNTGTDLGQQTLFDFPQEIQFQENEALGLAILGQTSDGFVFYHGCTLKDRLDDITPEDIAAEIDEYIPEPQLVPMLFEFASLTAGTFATPAGGGNDIFSTKNSRSVILTHVSCSTQAARLTLTDQARNQLICERVEISGIAADSTNKFTTYYRLPYPHLLRRGDRLKAVIEQGSILAADSTPINVTQFLTFKGYTV